MERLFIRLKGEEAIACAGVPRGYVFGGKKALYNYIYVLLTLETNGPQDALARN